MVVQIKRRLPALAVRFSQSDELSLRDVLREPAGGTYTLDRRSIRPRRLAFGGYFSSVPQFPWSGGNGLIRQAPLLVGKPVESALLRAMGEAVNILRCFEFQSFRMTEESIDLL